MQYRRALPETPTIDSAHTCFWFSFCLLGVERHFVDTRISRTPCLLIHSHMKVTTCRSASWDCWLNDTLYKPTHTTVLAKALSNPRGTEMLEQYIKMHVQKHRFWRKAQKRDTWFTAHYYTNCFKRCERLWSQLALYMFSYIRMKICPRICCLISDSLYSGIQCPCRQLKPLQGTGYFLKTVCFWMLQTLRYWFPDTFTTHIPQR